MALVLLIRFEGLENDAKTIIGLNQRIGLLSEGVWNNPFNEDDDSVYTASHLEKSCQPPAEPDVAVIVTRKPRPSLKEEV